MADLPADLEPWTDGEEGIGLLTRDGAIVHWRLDGDRRPFASDVADRLRITDAVRFSISPQGGISAVTPMHGGAGRELHAALQTIVSSDERWHVDESFDDPALWAGDD